MNVEYSSDSVRKSLRMKKLVLLTSACDVIFIQFLENYIRCDRFEMYCNVLYCLKKKK